MTVSPLTFPFLTSVQTHHTASRRRLMSSGSWLLSELTGHFSQFVPEEQRQDGVGAQAEIRGPQTFVESRHALPPQGLGETLGKAFIELPLVVREQQCQRQSCGPDSPSSRTPALTLPVASTGWL